MALFDDLLGRWVHAREQNPTATVFVRATSPIGPSRGRRVLEFRSDGTFVEGTPGPDDRSQRATGRWSLEGTGLRLNYSDDRPAEQFEIVASGMDHVLKKGIL